MAEPSATTNTEWIAPQMITKKYFDEADTDFIGQGPHEYQDYRLCGRYPMGRLFGDRSLTFFVERFCIEEQPIGVVETISWPGSSGPFLC